MVTFCFLSINICYYCCNLYKCFAIKFKKKYKSALSTQCSGHDVVINEISGVCSAWRSHGRLPVELPTPTVCVWGSSWDCLIEQSGSTNVVCTLWSEEQDAGQWVMALFSPRDTGCACERTENIWVLQGVFNLQTEQIKNRYILIQGIQNTCCSYKMWMEYTMGKMPQNRRDRLKK